MAEASGVRMAPGNGENSYATNSRLQEKAILETRPVLSKAIEEVLSTCDSTMVVADLGCSSGPNTLLVVSEVIGAIRAYTKKADDTRGVEVQFFLNDLPGNDFNFVFRSLEYYHNLGGGKDTPPYYVAGLPGSYYRKLFPRRSVHLFHSSYSLMWRSKIPPELSSCTHLNEGNIYIGKTTPPIVIKMFQEQFQKDFELFLTLRSRELVNGGRMLLTFLGRKSEEMLMHGDVATAFEWVSISLQSLVQKVHTHMLLQGLLLSNNYYTIARVLLKHM
uniref:Uncharacterized protein n=1 Tax=Avena sativa TaxID=4498 RepID=A0ACD5ZKR4_AVESA